MSYIFFKRQKMATLSILKEPIFGVLIGRLWRTETVFFEPYEWGLLGAHIQISPVYSPVNPRGFVLAENDTTSRIFYVYSSVFLCLI